MNKQKFLGIAVIALLLLNSGVIIWMLMHKPDHPPHPPHGMGMPHQPLKQVMKERLGLTDDQMATYDGLIETHRAGIREIDEQLRSKKRMLFNLLAEENTAEKDAALLEIGRLHQEIDALTFDHFLELKALCTADQKEKFNAMTDELLHLLGPKGKPGPPPVHP